MQADGTIVGKERLWLFIHCFKFLQKQRQNSVVAQVICHESGESVKAVVLNFSYIMSE